MSLGPLPFGAFLLVAVIVGGLLVAAMVETAWNLAHADIRRKLHSLQRDCGQLEHQVAEAEQRAAEAELQLGMFQTTLRGLADRTAEAEQRAAAAENKLQRLRRIPYTPSEVA